ncbi:protelomerase family protein [Anabaena sp. CCY 9402-a]|uniref:protelomerase family protein n=1 Tax=Anabaena sp. CCY 9402-a TaxID=3103867 RepID=UPI0039C73C4D
MLTAAEQAEKRAKVAKFGEEDLNLMSVAGLKQLAAGIVPNYSKLKKPGLISELMACSRAERVLVDLVPDIPLEALEENRSKVKAFSEDVNEDLGIWTRKLYGEFRALVQSRWKSDGTWDDAIHGDMAGLAYRVVMYLNQREGDQSDGGLSWATKLRYRTHICNLLSELVESELGAVYYKQLKSSLEMLLRQIKIQISELTHKKKGHQERRLAERKPQKATIDLVPLHDFAMTVLTNLDKLTYRDWKRVSIAMVIATGRRLAEVHQSSTIFELVDSHHVAFKGQLKVKGDAAKYFEDNPSYEIPVLVGADLVVVGHQWLKDNGKVVDSPEGVNRRYSGDISDAVKVLKGRLGIEHKFFTYKGLRTIYAQSCNAIFNNSDPDNTLFLAKILGHGRGELLLGDNLTDMLTPQSYNSDFVVVNTDVVKTRLGL